MSRFEERLRGGGFPIAFEITPPRTPRADILLRRAGLLGGRPDAINVIQRSGRIASLDAVIELQKSGFEAVWHLANRGRTGAEIGEQIGEARQNGVKLVLCIRGDDDAPDVDGGLRVRDVVERVLAEIPDALVGATLNQYGPAARVLRNLVAKIESGAGFVQTQPVFDLESLRPLAEELKGRRADTRIVAMLMPIVALAPLLRVRKRLELPVPASLVSLLERGDEEAAWAATSETLAEIVASPLVDGVAVMTPELDPERAFLDRLRRVLDAGLAAVG